jgi:hypothetical protein
VDDERSRWPNEFEGLRLTGWLTDGRIAMPLPLPNICHPSAMLLAAPSLLHTSIFVLLPPAL